MISFAATMSAYVTAGMLAASGFMHLLHVGSLRDALRAQRIWPARMELPLATVVTAIELGLGAYLLAVSGHSVLSHTSRHAQEAFLAAALLFSTYSAYGLVLHRYRAGVRCGCSAAPIPLTIWVPVRAATLTVLAGVAWLASGSMLSVGDDPAQISVSFLASIAIGVALWLLPTAMVNNHQVPGRSTYRSTV